VKKIKVSIKDVKEEGDKAVVTYTSSDNPTEQKLNLVKENDKWLVQFTKTDLVGVMPKDEDVPVEETPAADSTTITTDSVKK
jgi:GH25 family lysozyme M1 (1,4-beta-N-acetylmuramidase)